MFQTTRRRLALWYTIVTAVLLLLFASGFYWYVRNTLVERIDDTLNHVVEVVQRSLVIEPSAATEINGSSQPFHVNLESSFRSNAAAVEDDHIDLEWFSPTGQLLWSTFLEPLDVPLHPSDGETVYTGLPRFGEAKANWVEAVGELRQVTQRIEMGQQVLGYLRASHPWFEVTKPSQRLIRDLSLGTVLTVGAVAAMGWFLSGLAMAPVRDSYQRLRQFTADASHELRNPIAVIQTNVQVALADPDPHLQQDQLRVIERLTRRLGRLVDDLLFLARQDSGITPLKWETVCLNELMQEVVEEQRAIATEKCLELSLTFLDAAAKGQPSPGLIFADRDQLTRLMTNLIANAVQYTAAGGQVEVSWQRLKQAGNFYFQIQVKDTGIGISAESLPHVFDRFYRVDPARVSASVPRKSATTAESQSEAVSRDQSLAGSGLGLAIAKVIVEKHQGQIQVDSVPRQGTTFTVTLPCHRSDLVKAGA